jgi:hypothetical protein
MGRIVAIVLVILLIWAALKVTKLLLRLFLIAIAIAVLVGGYFLFLKQS